MLRRRRAFHHFESVTTAGRRYVILAGDIMQTPEAEGASIVMIGSFNPAIFQPRWLGAQQLIRAEEAEDAKITIIQAQVADFSTEWFQLQVLQQRFTVFTTDPRQ